MVLEGSTASEIALAEPALYISHARGIRELAFESLARQSRAFRRLKVLVLWGDAGVGKSRISTTLGGDNYFIMDNPNAGTIWWDGYHGQRTIIIDDFYGWIKYSRLLRILDGHQLRLATKGSHSWALWDRVIITSNDPPENWYQTGMTPALQRRIDMVCHLTTDLNIDWSEPLLAQLNIDGIDFN
jgi:hypothetical protein